MIIVYILLALYGYIAGVTYLKSIKVLPNKKKCLKMAIMWPIDFFKEWMKTVKDVSSYSLAKINTMGERKDEDLH